MAEKPRKMGLGRGLSALMADVDVTSAAAPQSTQTLPVEQITANPDQPRRAFDPEALAAQVAEGVKEIERGMAADDVAAYGAAGTAPRVPFFRFPGFGNTAPVETYAASKGVMIWGADMPADDWRKISAKEVAKRAIQRIEAKGKGVLLLHDIHERTVEALPVILKERSESTRLNSSH